MINEAKPYYTGLNIKKIVKSPFGDRLEKWVIPENIHTIPRTAFRISEGEGGFKIMEL